MTVLPTPAPPNRPALPPRTSGQSRSMTLMPVSNISVFEESSSSSGGARWIGRRSVAVDRAAVVDRLADQVEDAAERLDRRPAPMTGAPVSRMSAPRCRPSVEPRATARTRPPPRCWATSHHSVSLIVSPSTVRSTSTVQGVVDRRQLVLGELRVEGRADDLGDLAELPLSIVSISNVLIFEGSGQRVGAADDVQQLHGDLRSAGRGCTRRVRRLDHVVGGVGGRLHRHHARHLLGDRRRR